MPDLEFCRARSARPGANSASSPTRETHLRQYQKDTVTPGLSILSLSPVNVTVKTARFPEFIQQFSRVSDGITFALVTYHESEE